MKGSYKKCLGILQAEIELYTGETHELAGTTYSGKTEKGTAESRKLGGKEKTYEPKRARSSKGS